MNPRLSSISRRSGMALILVLAAVAFISILTVGFLVSVNHELVTSKNYASGASSHIYADAAVNLVVGQLQGGTTPSSANQTWTSQPGLVRLFDNTGNILNSYKLYSSSQMVVAGNTFAPLDGSGNPADVPTWTSSTPSASLPWVQYPNVYTDLNSPITVNSVTKFPILNPGGLNPATQIEGFSVSSMVSGNAALANQIPMPVTWLYVLTDGRIATPKTNPADPTAVTLTTPDGTLVAANNPPVARVAFWTDDNTCRLNINTASEGSFWTLPFDEVNGDAGLGKYMVQANEYQRYPGHPATTCLSPVFDYLTNSGATTNDMRNFIYALSPRVAGRGSQFASRYIGYGKPVIPDSDRLYESVDELLFLPKVNTGTGARYPTTTANIQSFDTNQLDWAFSSTSATVTNGAPYTFSGSFGLDAAHLELARFFLTTDSRAPEINLFGQPRVSLWPVDTRSAYQSVWDKSLAFASTVGGSSYYFQRQNPASQTDDYLLIQRNKDLYAYLDHATSTQIPGYGGNFSTKYAAADRAQVLTSIFDWIRTVNLAYPDTTGTVSDYAWSANSAYNPASSGAFIPPGKPGSGQVLPIKINSTQGYGRFPTLSKAALGIVRESEVADTPTVGQTTINYRVVLLMETYVPMMGYAGYIPDYHIQVNGPTAFTFTAKTSAPASAPATLTSAVSIPSGDIHVTAPCNFEAFSGRAWGGTQGFNNLFLYSDSANNYQLTKRTIGGTDPNTGYPFASGTVSFVFPTKDKGLINVGLAPSSSPATVAVSFYDSTDATSIASYSVPFSTFGPVPGAYLSATNAAASTAPITAGVALTTGSSDEPPDLSSRMDQMIAVSTIINNVGNDWPGYKNIFGVSDVVRGVELNHGDLRISAIAGTDANSKFVSSKNYTSTAMAQAHTLLCANGNAYPIDRAFTTYTNTIIAGPPAVTNWYGTNAITVQRGTLVAQTASTFTPASTKTVGTPGSFEPQVPSLLNQATNSTGAVLGDFSNGIGSEGDGPHIMKADEGNSSFLGESWGESDAFPYQNQFFPYDGKLAAAFSPNREVSSAVQLGTLPSQPKTPVPWQTLLFRPDYTGVHPGALDPKDYLLLDLFWMPVTDPYPISEQFSTAGKVNMNYQIVPFTYITRATAMIGALKATKVGAIAMTGNSSDISNFDEVSHYKHSAWVVAKDGNGFSISNLYAVDPFQTLLFFTEKFSNSNPQSSVFKSPAEICNIPLIPMNNTNTLYDTKYPNSVSGAGVPINTVAKTIDMYNQTTASGLRTQMASFWAGNTLTGDNTLEAPYNALYPRLTTQSNTYTVYVHTQALQVTGSPGGGVFTGISDRVTGEYRGAYEVERYIDLNNTSIPDFAQPANYGKTIYPYYKFRVVSTKQFIP